EYVPESDLEAHPEDDDDEDSEEDPVDYLADGGDDDDDDEGERGWLWDHRLVRRDSGDFTGATVSTYTKLGGYMREFETRVRQDTEEIYMRLDDEQIEQQLLAGRLNMLFRDRRAHAYTRHLMETEARLSREAWVRSTDASDLVRGEVMSLRTTGLGQMTEIKELHAADRRRQIVISEMLRADHRRSTEIIGLRTALQGQVTALQGQELALLCGRMFSEESYKIEKYIRGLPDMIHGSVVASKPKTMQEAVEIATGLMDKKIRTFAKRETASKRKFENTSRNTQNHQQQSNKRQNTGRNNNNHGNQGGRNNALARVYVVGRAWTDPDANVMTVGRAWTDPDANVVMGMFLLNNRYASVLFDTGADKSLVSTTFSTQISITPSTLDHCYDVELADERIIGLNTILRGCTLNLLNYPFNINLMPVELGSFDAIIGMDWLAKYQAVIACTEKIVRIPWGKSNILILSVRNFLSIAGSCPCHAIRTDQRTCNIHGSHEPGVQALLG
nr:reverse transcriptase domain-containing protein [Tanacetum cinerariifolium]